ncbi:uncharacterized protein LOC124553730 isoform X4 [Schistocerca americana]|uniref:uncharacterized protein LOC124553730 isoform X4 n=1 Tax=Schistocerca americana TaxID=7009 RepID=UPI001F4F2280|nr:uncharacterized protein LOC124553730 isoform X4 [Schistocerca americana]
MGLKDSTKAVLDAILEAESDCCPPPSLVPREDVESMESEVQNDMKPVFALLVPLTPSEEPVLETYPQLEDYGKVTYLESSKKRRKD